MNRVLYSGFRFSHHNSGSGYDELVADRRHYVCGDDLPCAEFPEASFPRHLNFLLTDLVTFVRGLRYDTVHYLYPENTAYLSPWLLRLCGKRIVYTLHLMEREWLGPVQSPFMRLKQFSLGSATAIAVLSRGQIDVYTRRFRDKVVAFVPHGLDFDTSQDVPAELFARRKADKSVVVVGQNYRDFDLLQRILETRGSRSLSFQLVGMDAAVRTRFSAEAQVVCHDRLDRATYEHLVRGAFAMLLPLSFATANNAALEAYKFYLPVLASRIPGVRDYAIDADALFGTAEEFWEKYDALCGLDADALRERCCALHQRAQELFSWQAVRGQLEALYRS